MEDYIDIIPISKKEVATKPTPLSPRKIKEDSCKSEKEPIKNMVKDVDLVCYDCPNLYVKQSGKMNGVSYEQCECTLMSSPVRPSFYSWEWMWDSNEHDNRKPFDMLVKYKCPNIQKFREKMTAVRLPPKKG